MNVRVAYLHDKRKPHKTTMDFIETAWPVASGKAIAPRVSSSSHRIGKRGSFSGRPAITGPSRRSGRSSSTGLKGGRVAPKDKIADCDGRDGHPPLSRLGQRGLRLPSLFCQIFTEIVPKSRYD